MVHSLGNDILNKEVKNWTVSSYVGRNKSGKPVYSCVCDCGEEKELDIYRLKSEDVPKCKVEKYKEYDLKRIGMKFGKLTIIKISDKKNKYNKSIRYYTCKCECGNEKDFSWESLLRKDKKTESCGCTHLTRTHGKSRTKIYKIWDSMKYRCYHEGSQNWKNYGARGIKVYDEWIDNENGFINFYNWAIESGYVEGLSIERIDVDGNYEPLNCKWITRSEQSLNKRDSIILNVNGENKPLKIISEEYNIKYGTLIKRLESGMTIEEAINKPVVPTYKNKLIEINGEKKTYEEWSKISGIKIGTLRGRYHEGLRGEDLIKPLKRGTNK